MLNIQEVFQDPEENGYKLIVMVYVLLTVYSNKL